MIWEHLASPDFDSINRDIPIVLSIAAIEQHGQHLPLDVDSRIGQHFCDQLNELLSDQILILPQVKICCSQHHMDFPGTLTVSHATFLSYVQDVLDSVFAHGFRNVLLLNSHGGNQSIGRVVVELSGAKFRSAGGGLAIGSWWDIAKTELRGLNESGKFGIGHACEFETSLMLAIAPETVRTDQLSDQNFVPFSDWTDSGLMEAAPVLMFRSMYELTGGKGTLGNPSTASAAKGRAISDVVVTNLVAMISEIRQSLMQGQPDMR